MPDTKVLVQFAKEQTLDSLGLHTASVLCGIYSSHLSCCLKVCSKINCFPFEKGYKQIPQALLKFFSLFLCQMAGEDG